MMCCWAGFNAHQAGRQIGEELKDLAAADTLADHHSAITIHAVDLKHGLRNIQADRDNFAHGRLPSSGSLRCNHPMAPRCRRVGAVHSIKSTRSDRDLTTSAFCLTTEEPKRRQLLRF